MAKVSTKRIYWISTPEEVRLLASAVRQEIVDSLAAIGPCTIRDLATALGTPADGLYYHLRMLADAGLVVEDGTRETVRRDAVVYRLPAAQVRLDYGAGPDVLTGIGDVISAALRTAAREFTAGLESGAAVTDGPRANLVGGRKKAWLSPADLAKLNALLDEVFELFESARPGEGRELCGLSVVLSPIAPMPARRGTGSST